ncbi:RNA polymerase subunit sigma [Siphonobacter curvatus]|uniref:RNA polymerase subunit sigma n=2 Tax=Siphonobacter curvatus TaxID=2094562 RepID=A0A2S7ITR5_9BACT|nr:RNA polymerase subunit sigma [Siphonobacter curvatus]
MTATICRHFSIRSIEIAEDIVSDTFLKASEYWAISGVPDNPTAWLYTVAINKSKDYIKRLLIFEKLIVDKNQQEDQVIDSILELDGQLLENSELQMIFAICDSVNSQENQITLALQVICGFSVEEIANAFFSKTETIKKRLFRAKNTLRNSHFKIKPLTEGEITSRIDCVLKTLYILFNEGYYSKTSDQLIRKKLCSEAIRLVLALVDNISTSTKNARALLALMCFQSSRLDARTDNYGEIILFEDQDRNLWDLSLIERGQYYLASACTGNEVSTYHIEAAISYWHSTSTGTLKWEPILRLYDQLVLLKYSSVIALNRIFALSKVYGNDKAIREVEKLSFLENSYYHLLLGYLYTESHVSLAVKHYRKAIALTKSKRERSTLNKLINHIALDS